MELEINWSRQRQLPQQLPGRWSAHSARYAHCECGWFDWQGETEWGRGHRRHAALRNENRTLIRRSASRRLNKPATAGCQLFKDAAEWVCPYQAQTCPFLYLPLLPSAPLHLFPFACFSLSCAQLQLELVTQRHSLCHTWTQFKGCCLALLL